MLTTAELAGRGDFTLGLAAVSPSSRRIAGPGGAADVEPRVMQVLVVLSEAAGQVVTRETLFQRCWGGVYVGDDSLNRTISAVRKLAAEIGGGSFEIETIPRTGYRLNGQVSNMSPGAPAEEVQRGLTRRQVIGAATALTAAAAGVTIWSATRSRGDARFDALMAQGDEAFRNGSAFEDLVPGDSKSPAMASFYGQAVKLRPDSARAWGLLAYFQSVKAVEAPAGESAGAIASTQTAARRALDLDPREPNARMAMFMLQGAMLDWAARDRQLRDILATDPQNIPAMLELMPLLQAAGLTRESWTWNERILAQSPLLRPGLVVRAMKLWILGKTRQSDAVLDRVLGLWPNYPFANYARFTIFALTGRPRAARTVLAAAPRLPEAETRKAVLDALETRTPSTVAAAEAACVATARSSPADANDVIMYLCALGLPNTAFEVTEGFLLWRGKLVSTDSAKSRTADQSNRQMTQWLFTPPVANMRADPRFAKLCEEFGLTDYWRARGVRPDYQVYA